MNRLRAIIIDDEKHCAETLEWQLNQFCPNVELLGLFLSPIEGLAAIKKQKPDLVFLDIEMPKMNGFQLLKSIDEINFGVIFTTAFDQFAVQAFKVSALDYLVKPIDDDELKLAVEKAEHAVQKDTAVSIEFLLEQIQDKKLSNRLFLPTLNGLEFVDKEAVIRCESDSNYTTVYFENTEKMVISKTLKEFEALLPESHFFRVHHYHIVNLLLVQKYVRGDGGHLVMKNGNIVPVSRAKKHHLLEYLQA
ncbi:MAG: two-component system LytT family response regulator [Crocinitomix sp.]|jgi:two-component system LytT family response regulator